VYAAPAPVEKSPSVDLDTGTSSPDHYNPDAEA
jgi:hypothetical protein